MKKPLSLLLTISLLGAYIPLALAINPPKIDPVKSPVDAKNQTITGTTVPGATVNVVGGASALPQEIADSKGKFKIIVELVQDHENTFQITVADKSGQSKPITIKIVESAEKAKKAQEEEGIDNIAPDAPEVDEPESPVDAKTATLTGSAEPGAVVSVTGADTAEAKTDEDGYFEVEVSLKQNQKNRFDLFAIDEAGNLSERTIVEIKEEGAEEIEVAAPFTDTTGHFAETYINNLREKGIVKGYKDGSYGVNNNINRAELTQMALVAFEFNIASTVTEKPFNDVDTGVWFTNVVATAKNEKVVGGYTDGTFKPGANITRAEALKIMFEAAKIKVEATNESFSDVPTGDQAVWFTPYATFAKTNAISQGYTDNGVVTFQPGRDITRAEVAVMLVKIMELKAKLQKQQTI